MLNPVQRDLAPDLSTSCPIPSSCVLQATCVLQCDTCHLGILSHGPLLLKLSKLTYCLLNSS